MNSRATLAGKGWIIDRRYSITSRALSVWGGWWEIPGIYHQPRSLSGLLLPLLNTYLYAATSTSVIYVLEQPPWPSLHSREDARVITGPNKTRLKTSGGERGKPRTTQMIHCFSYINPPSVLSCDPATQFSSVYYLPRVKAFISEIIRVLYNWAVGQMSILTLIIWHIDQI